MVQICPSCKKTMPEESTVCPSCGYKLIEYKICPFCKNEITNQDTVCPHCNNLLIYDYPNQVTAKRNSVLFPLGFLLLLSAVLYWFLGWTGIIEQSGLAAILFIALWLLGFVFYGAYIGKGDTDFWWGK
jgi:RNA polymerase subunit RPABC4/transcription elongation factor Spt4